MNIKKAIKKFLSYFLVYLGLTLLFSSLMIATYTLPNARIRGHIAESVGQLKSEGMGYAPFFQEIGGILDTHTDSLILNIAMNKGTSNEDRILAKAFENSFYEDETGAGISSLEANIQDETFNNHEYSRYWHGNQVIIRPLLMFFNYMEIRYIFMMIIFILIGIVFSMIGKQLGNRYNIAFSITMAFMFVILIPMSIQYSSIFIVTLISMIMVLLLYKYKKERNIPILFFIIGAFATFFDLLTYPLVSLGLPIVLAVLLENKKNQKTILNQILFILKLGILWVIGYGLLFFTKWIIASVALQKDAITLALNEILFRVNGNDSNPVDRLDTLKSNFDYFFIPVGRYVLIGIFMIWGILFTFFRKKIKELKIIIPLVCISIVPYIWYIVFAGHSYIHCWFTYRIQAMTVFSILCAMFISIDEEKLKRLKIRRGNQK